MARPTCAFRRVRAPAGVPSSGKHVDRSTVRILVMVAALVAILAPATAAAASPTQEQIDQQITAQQNKLEQVVEAYNKINIDLADSQTQARQLNDQPRMLAGRLADARSRTDEIAAIPCECGPRAESVPPPPTA